MPTDDTAPWIWLLVAWAFMGLVLGLRFKVGALIVASTFVLLVDAVATMVAGWRFDRAALMLVVSLLAVQMTYAVGLYIGHRTRFCGKD